jgi:hypothetical protein
VHIQIPGIGVSSTITRGVWWKRPQFEADVWVDKESFGTSEVDSILMPSVSPAYFTWAKAIPEKFPYMSLGTFQQETRERSAKCHGSVEESRHHITASTYHQKGVRDHSHGHRKWHEIFY